MGQRQERNVEQDKTKLVSLKSLTLNAKLINVEWMFNILKTCTVTSVVSSREASIHPLNTLSSYKQQ